MTSLILAIFLYMGGYSITLNAGSGELPPFNGGPGGCGMQNVGGGEISYPLNTWLTPCGGPYHHICFDTGGYYNVNLQMSMEPGPVAEGSISMDSVNVTSSWWDPLPRSTMLLYWKAGSSYTLQGNSVTVQAYPGECFQLNYSATAAATVNQDPRVTRMTIQRL